MSSGMELAGGTIQQPHCGKTLLKVCFTIERELLRRGASLNWLCTW